MMTREADYAIRAAVYLAGKENDSTPISTLDLAEKMEIPYRFLRKIIKQLVDEKIVISRRGKGGGLTLARPSKEITLFELVKTFDERGLALNYCLREGNDCSRKFMCKVHCELKSIQTEVDSRLQAVTLDTLQPDAE